MDRNIFLAAVIGIHVEMPIELCLFNLMCFIDIQVIHIYWHFFLRMNLGLKLLLCRCMISVLIPTIPILATHIQVNKSNESTRVISTQEHLEEAFEEQVP